LLCFYNDEKAEVILKYDMYLHDEVIDSLGNEPSATAEAMDFPAFFRWLGALHRAIKTALSNYR
jgi:hypothetical protein